MPHRAHWQPIEYERRASLVSSPGPGASSWQPGALGSQTPRPSVVYCPGLCGGMRKSGRTRRSIRSE
ncbi:hypothetical protein B4Q13_17000 [Lacticaseibacillus rhamnosus]